MGTYDGGHRVTYWHNARGDIVQLSVACLDEMSEAVCEVTEQVGPFDTVDEVRAQAEAIAHSLGGWRAHQTTLL